MKLLFLYPRAWRERYGDELEALLEGAPLRRRDVSGILAAALREQFHMQSFQWLVGWLAGAGLAAGFACSFAIAPRYRTHATVELGSSDAEAARVTVLSRFQLAALIEDPLLNLYNDENRHEPLEDLEDDMRQDLRITEIPSKEPNTARLSSSSPIATRGSRRRRSNRPSESCTVASHRKHSKTQTLTSDTSTNSLDLRRRLRRSKSGLALHLRRRTSGITAPRRPANSDRSSARSFRSVPSHPTVPPGRRRGLERAHYQPF